MDEMKVALIWGRPSGFGESQGFKKISEGEIIRDDLKYLQMLIYYLQMRQEVPLYLSPQLGETRFHLITIPFSGESREIGSGSGTPGSSMVFLENEKVALLTSLSNATFNHPSL